jgi:hypothetical protein
MPRIGNAKTYVKVLLVAGPYSRQSYTLQSYLGVCLVVY